MPAESFSFASAASIRRSACLLQHDLSRMPPAFALSHRTHHMQPIHIDLLGYAAAALTSIAFIPQAWLTWKTRSARGVSLGMYTIFIAGVAGWLVYGLLIGSWPVVVANAVTLALACFIFGMKLRFG
jgi:MtN3 and saliva related transmembrane protein